MSSKIEIDRNADQALLDSLGVTAWPTWEAGVSEFPWHYDASETCYFLAGDVTVTPEGGSPVRVGAGDLVTFPQGLSCTWLIHAPVRKHYRFG